MPSKQAIVFVPGFGTKGNSYYIDKYLTYKVKDICRANSWHFAESIANDDMLDLENSGRRRLEIKQKQQERDNCLSIDIYEVYWQDLVKQIEQEKIQDKIVNELFLFLNTCVSLIKYLRKIRKNTIGRSNNDLGLSGIYWFTMLSILVALISDIWLGYKLIVLQGTDVFALDGKLLQKIFEILKDPLNWMPLLIVSLRLLFFGRIIIICDFLACYLKSHANRIYSLKYYGFEINERILNAIVRIKNYSFKETQDKYETVTLVAHSLGTLFTTEVLAKYSNYSEQKIKYITLGSPLAFLAVNNRNIDLWIEHCSGSDCLHSWDDYYSNEDPFCTGAIDKIDNNKGKCAIHLMTIAPNINRLRAWWDFAPLHLFYFDDESIVKKIYNLEATKIINNNC